MLQAFIIVLREVLEVIEQYQRERGKPQKNRVVARWQSYHGNTLGALSAGGNRWRRAQFASLFATRDREIGMRSFVENGPGKAVFEGA